MTRRQFSKMILGIAVASASVLIHGCKKPTPQQVEGEQKKCAHEWGEASSGEKRCKKCGVYAMGIVEKEK